MHAAVIGERKWTALALSGKSIELTLLKKWFCRRWVIQLSFYLGERITGKSCYQTSGPVTRNSIWEFPTGKTGQFFEMFQFIPEIFQRSEPKKCFPFTSKSKFPEFVTKLKAPLGFEPENPS